MWLLLTAPRCVKYKPNDRLGPLGLLVRPEGSDSATAAKAERVFGRAVLTAELMEAAETFRREWLARQFSKAELAGEIEQCLEEMGMDSRELNASARTAAWRVTASVPGSQEGALDEFFRPSEE